MEAAATLFERLDIHNPDVRRFIIDEYGLAGFCWIYLPHHFYQEPADFHPELIEVFESPDVEMVEVIGFRGSAKSTYGSLAVPLYFALEDKHKFIIPAGDTTTQTKLNLENIRHELESNEMILKDYGLAFDPRRNWSDNKLLLNNGVLILGRSRGQKIRGLKHRQYRPQVVIIDDAEDLEWVKEKKNRDKTERWVNGEVIPAVQENQSKLIIIGNLLHNDALMARLKKKKKEDGTPLFRLMEFPLIDENGHCTWRGKYPDEAAIQKQREKVGPTAWAREYRLKIIAEEDQIIKETDIHRYPNALLTRRNDYGKLEYTLLDSGQAMDLAISEKTNADFTAIVGGYRVKLLLDEDERPKLLILPGVVNKHMGYDDTLKEAVRIGGIMPHGTRWYVEEVGYQAAARQGMHRKSLSVVPMRPITDKRARLESVSPFIKDGTVLFPESGCENLLEQLIGFGVEAHDDMVDALVYLIMGMLMKRKPRAVGKIDQL